MSKITITGADEASAMLKAIGKQASYALMLGVNNTGLAAQHETLKHANRALNMRGTQRFFEKGVVFRKGTKAKPEATLSIGVDGAWPGTATLRATAILRRHEDPQTRTSNQVFKAGNTQVESGFFLPARGMRTNSTNPPRSVYPRNIGALTRRDVDGSRIYASSKKSKGSVKKGTKETRSYYVIPRVGIFERQSSSAMQLSGKSRGRPIWFFSRTVRTPARTGFEATATATIEREFLTHLSKGIDKALATAK